MRIRLWFTLAIVISALAALAFGQTAKKPDPKKAIAVTAEALGKEFLKDGPRAEKKYAGKTLRVTGTVDSAIEELVYLRTGLKYKQGQEMSICLRFEKADIPKVKTAQKVTVEGVFDREAVLGPSLKECHLIVSKK